MQEEGPCCVLGQRFFSFSNKPRQEGESGSRMTPAEGKCGRGKAGHTIVGATKAHVGTYVLRWMN